MKKKLISLVATVLVVLAYFLYSQSKPQPQGDFQITFIDVGQGDAALIMCDGEYMLIDAGPDNKETCQKLQTVLHAQKVFSLKYLVISHLHEDHYGGVVAGGLENVTVEQVLCNEDPYERERLGRQLNGCRITVPEQADTFTLGSASVEVIDASARENNDSLVLLVRYGNTNFLFTGDIEQQAHSRVAERLRAKEHVLAAGENLIKMPHHGAYNSDLYLPENAWDNSLATLLSAAYPKYFVISVGEGNSYGHPHRETLELIDQVLRANRYSKGQYLYRTDQWGDIVFTSDGKQISIVR